MGWARLLLSAEGRIGRKTFWLANLAFAVLSAVGGFLDGLFGPDVPGPGVIGTITAIASFFPNLCINVKRMHDVGRSGFWLLSPVPAAMLGFAVGGVLSLNRGPDTGLPLTLPVILATGGVVLTLWIVMGFLKGAAGPNKYGEPASGQRRPAPSTADIFT